MTAWTRPIGPRRGGRRGGRSGVALLLVISIIALMSMVVVEVMGSARVRFMLAAAQRDEAKAEALASGGVQFYRLLLIASKQLEGSGLIAMAAQYGIPLNADTLWQLIPKINSGVMRLLLLSGGDADDAADRAKTGKALTDEERAQSIEEAKTSLKKPFLDFDGDFEAEVNDEDKRINIKDFAGANMVELMSNPNAGLLAALMSGDKQEAYLREKNIEKWELIAALADWMDADDQRLWDGGSETSTYEAMSEEDAPYRPKNAPFDTVDEIRLVEGWNNDGVWARFGQHLTIYGSGRVNVNTADRRIMEALLRRFVQPVPTEDSLALIWQQIQMFRSTPMTAEGGGGVWHDVGNFVAFLRQVVPGTIDPQIEQLCATSSTVFRVRSTGMVGEASVTQTAVFQFPQTQQGQPGGSRLAGAFGRVLYWHVQ